MSDRKILILEKRRRWVPELKRHFSTEFVVHGSQRVADLRDKLDAFVDGLLILDLVAAPADCLQFLGWYTSRPGAQPVIVIASARWRDLEWPIRELGAAQFFVGPLPSVRLVEFCRRILRPSADGHAKQRPAGRKGDE